MKKLIFILVICSMLICGCSNGKISTRDEADYTLYFGENTDQRNSTLISIDIFPENIPDTADIEEFSYESINTFDPNYTGKLVYICSDADFEEEVQRLEEIGIKDYSDHPYGITEFPQEVVAFDFNNHGIVYAMINKDMNEIIYVEIVFCNYFSDINYSRIIGEKYLPQGFDATITNQVRKKFTNSVSD